VATDQRVDAARLLRFLPGLGAQGQASGLIEGGGF